jgi:hypothetical protein
LCSQLILKMSYKYQLHIEKYNLTNCPPVDGAILPCECYHYIFEDIQDKNNFLPHSMRKPEDFVILQDSKKCSWIGLSCYADYEKAVENWNHWNKIKKGKFAKQVGNFLSKLKLDINDGTTSIKESNSHFNFYEYQSCELHKKITGTIALI